MESDDTMLDRILQNAKIDVNSIITKINVIGDSQKGIEQLAQDVANVPSLAAKLSTSPLATPINSATISTGSPIVKDDKILEKVSSTVQKQAIDIKPLGQKPLEVINTGVSIDTSKHSPKEPVKVDSNKPEIREQGKESIKDNSNNI